MSDGYAMALIGAQWGSEGKGVIAAGLAHSFRGAVRVGGPNAGHSFYCNGQLFKMRSVPCLWPNGEAVLMIGAGAVINPSVLLGELAILPPDIHVVVDPSAVLVTHHHEEAELATIRHSIGSTAEGVGEARIDRIRRNGSAVRAVDFEWGTDQIEIGDVATLAADLMEVGGRIMLEGTQGSGLSLYHGTQYPYATSTDTNAAGLASEAGVAPSKVGCTQLVVRSYPIRVAGSSGPMGEELSWDQMMAKFQIEVPEQTTVTKKTRRISEWYGPVVDRAVMLNQPCGFWLTFGDYLDPDVRGSDRGNLVWGSKPIRQMIDYLEGSYGVPVLGVGTGPGTDPAGRPDFMVAQLATHCLHQKAYPIDWAGVSRG